VVQVRCDSGAIEDVLHLEPQRFRKGRRPLTAFPQFKLQTSGRDQAAAMQILLEEMPEAVVLRRGVPLVKKLFQEVYENDLLEVHWKNHRFYLRFVEKTKIPVIKRGTRDPLLLRISLIGAFITVCGLLIAVTRIHNMVAEPPAPLPRVATIEVAEPVQPEVKLEPPLAEPVPDAKPVAKVEKVKPTEAKQVDVKPVQAPPVDAG